MSFELPKLAYSLDGLLPQISKEQMEYHHLKHHQAYVTKLNSMIKGTSEEEWALEKFFAIEGGVKRNQAAQIWNHTFYFNSMTPNSAKSANAPSNKIADLIDRDFGSIDKFWELFTAKGLGHFASGWIWLVQDTDGKLAIVDSHDASNPLIDGTGKPIIGCDVWEHAYYIDYRNARGGYLQSFKELVNWKFAETNLIM